MELKKFEDLTGAEYEALKVGICHAVYPYPGDMKESLEVAMETLIKQAWAEKGIAISARPKEELHKVASDESAAH